MRPIEYYLDHADELAHKVVTSWETDEQAGSDEFLALFDKASQYQIAKRVAEERRGEPDLERMDAVEEKATQRAFAEAYKTFEDGRGRQGAHA